MLNAIIRAILYDIPFHSRTEAAKIGGVTLHHPGLGDAVQCAGCCRPACSPIDEKLSPSLNFGLDIGYLTRAVDHYCWPAVHTNVARISYGGQDGLGKAQIIFVIVTLVQQNVVFGPVHRLDQLSLA